MSVMSLPEWLVLVILGQQPAHGFAVAQLTSSDGELGRVWQVPKAVIYRAIGRLADAGLIVPESVEPGQGPQRTVYAVTPEGRAAAREWLYTPVEHVRDIRSHLLLKLALLDRAEGSATGDQAAGDRTVGDRVPGDRMTGGQAAEIRAELLRRQRLVLEPIVRAIGEQQAGPGFDRVLLAWRRSTAAAALDFIDSIS